MVTGIFAVLHLGSLNAAGVTWGFVVVGSCQLGYAVTTRPTRTFPQQVAGVSEDEVSQRRAGYAAEVIAHRWFPQALWDRRAARRERQGRAGAF